MKKIIYALSFLSILSLTSCDLFEMDNYDGPNAQISGRLIDAKTGENIQIETYSTAVWNWSTWPPTVEYTNAGSLIVVEEGWDAESDQAWMVKYNGDYENDLVFAGTYHSKTTELPCYPVSEQFVIKEGKNTKDFTLTPYGRVNDVNITYDSSTRKIKATFKVELGDASKANRITNVRLLCNTSNYVSTSFNLCANDPGARKNNVSPDTAITLEIDTTADSNNEEFKYKRPHYLRIAALVQGNNYNTSGWYNFSKTYVMSEDFSSVKEYDWSSAK